MSTKSIVPRASAVRDVEAAVDFYAQEAGERTAFRFIDALERAYRMIAAHPQTGAPRYGHELDIPGLRSRQLSGYPYLVFYVERGDHIDVWRILHGQRDIPVSLQ